MNGYKRRTNAKKDSIIKTAWELFSERGIKDVSIKEIAAKAKVSQVSIYNYFGDKNNLAKEALISYIDKVIESYDEILERNIPFSEKLKIIMDKKYSAVVDISQSPFTKYAQKDKTLQQIYKEASTTKAISIYKKFIKLGKEEGAIDHTISDDAIMSFLLSIVSIMQQPDYLKTSLEYRMDIFRLFLYGILGKEE